MDGAVLHVMASWERGYVTESWQGHEIDVCRFIAVYKQGRHVELQRIFAKHKFGAMQAGNSVMIYDVGKDWVTQELVIDQTSTIELLNQNDKWSGYPFNDSSLRQRAKEMADSLIAPFFTVQEVVQISPGTTPLTSVAGYIVTVESVKKRKYKQEGATHVRDIWVCDDSDAAPIQVSLWDGSCELHLLQGQKVRIQDASVTTGKLGRRSLSIRYKYQIQVEETGDCLLGCSITPVKVDAVPPEYTAICAHSSEMHAGRKKVVLYCRPELLVTSQVQIKGEKFYNIETFGQYALSFTETSIEPDRETLTNPSVPHTEILAVPCPSVLPTVPKTQKGKQTKRPSKRKFEASPGYSLRSAVKKQKSAMDGDKLKTTT